MKWSEQTYSDYYIPFDENQRAIRGFFLTTLHLNLEDLPYILNQPFEYRSRNDCTFTDYSPRKVYLKDIVGTFYKDYGGRTILQSFMRIKRGAAWITKGETTRNKYFVQLKKPISNQSCPIMLAYDPEVGKYWVDRNGNHRVIFYKIMMLAEIAEKYEWPCSENFDLSFNGFNDVAKRYWLNAMVHDIC